MSLQKTRILFPFFQKLITSDIEHAASIAHLLDLTDQELLFLLGSDRDKVKGIQEDTQNKESIRSEENKRKDKNTLVDVPSKKTSQQRLHDF